MVNQLFQLKFGTFILGKDLFLRLYFSGQHCPRIASRNCVIFSVLGMVNRKQTIWPNSGTVISTKHWSPMTTIVISTKSSMCSKMKTDAKPSAMSSSWIARWLLLNTLSLKNVMNYWQIQWRSTKITKPMPPDWIFSSASKITTCWTKVNTNE